MFGGGPFDRFMVFFFSATSQEQQTIHTTDGALHEGMRWFYGSHDLEVLDDYVIMFSVLTIVSERRSSKIFRPTKFNRCQGGFCIFIENLWGENQDIAMRVEKIEWDDCRLPHVNVSI